VLYSHSPFRHHKTKDKHEIDRMTLNMVRPVNSTVISLHTQQLFGALIKIFYYYFHIVLS